MLAWAPLPFATGIRRANIRRARERVKERWRVCTCRVEKGRKCHFDKGREWDGDVLMWLVVGGDGGVGKGSILCCLFAVTALECNEKENIWAYAKCKLGKLAISALKQLRSVKLNLKTEMNSLKVSCRQSTEAANYSQDEWESFVVS